MIGQKSYNPLHLNFRNQLLRSVARSLSTVETPKMVRFCCRTTIDSDTETLFRLQLSNSQSASDILSLRFLQLASYFQLAIQPRCQGLSS